jgi:hypothetical protein
MRIAVGFVVVAALVVPLAGCALADRVVSHESERSFATWQDAQEAEARFVPAAFVPQDATGLRTRILTNADDAITMFSSPSAPSADECEPAGLDGEPDIATSWWPAIPDEGWVCGDWHVFVIGETGYGYRS